MIALLIYPPPACLFKCASASVHFKSRAVTVGLEKLLDVITGRYLKTSVVMTQKQHLKSQEK